MTVEMTKDIDVTKLYDLVNKLANMYRNELVNINAVASGKLVNFTREIDWDGTKFTVSFDLPDHWYYIEHGRKKTTKGNGKELYNAILNWVKLKGITARDGKDQTSLAWAITKKIHKLGYFGTDHHGKQPLTKALERARADGTIDAIADCVADGFGNQIRVSLAELENMTKK